MKRLRRFLARVTASVLGRRDDERLREEMAEHLTLLTDANIRAGASPADARRQARLTLGPPEAITERYRDEQRLRLLEDLWHDLRYAVRMLRRSPGFAVVALLSLGLGIGASTSMFQLVDAVRLRDLPVRSPAQLRSVAIGGDGPSGNFTARYGDLSSAQWEQIARRQQAFSAIAAWSPRAFNLADGGEKRRAEGMYVSGSFFAMLGVDPWRGRLFTSADDSPACDAPAAVISHGFWQRELTGDLSAIGSQLRVDGHTFTIAGITPPGFFGVEVGRAYDIAIPLCAERLLAADSQLTVHRHNYWLSAIGRLRDGWTAEQADAHLRAISPLVFALVSCC
jgi:putative ABC transport system permease protein